MPRGTDCPERKMAANGQRGWKAEGHSGVADLGQTQKSPAGAGLSGEAAEGIRTLDLLHGKQTL
jgi:hypothetical protein